MNVKTRFEQQIRQWLDAKQKPLFFYLLFPLLISVSFLVALINKTRRFLLARHNQIQKNDPYLKVILIGDLTLGGSGKTPLVSYLATNLLNENYRLIILTKGYKSHSSQFSLIVSSHDRANLRDLGDEGREYFLRLEALSKTLSTNSPSHQDPFFIVQNSSKKRGFETVKQLVKTFPNDQKMTICLVDDGLQSFTITQRDYEICILDEKTYRNSPLFSYPWGPFREGFGRKSMTELLDTYPVRVWSRSYTKIPLDLTLTAKRLHLALNSQTDFILSYELSFFKSSHLFKTVFNTVLIRTEVVLFAGIAHPEQFSQTLKELFPQVTFTSFFLSDHGELTPSFLDFLDNGQNYQIMTTLKDYARFQFKSSFQDLLKRNNHELIIAVMETEILDQQGHPMNLLKHILQKNNLS